jgi:hypothetical protein
MSHEPDEALGRLLRASLPPVGEAELEHDLWARALRRLEAPALRASRLDWALAGSVLAWLVVFPETVLGLLYHL